MRRESERLVADASDIIRHQVLHIGPQPPASSGESSHRSPLAELVAGLPLQTQWCGDVYRGLARILRPSPDPPKAVIVCLDGLGAAEFEFFSIVSRLRRDLKVYVYAAARSESRMAKAVELGATGPVTRGILAELASIPSVPVTVEAPTRASEHVVDPPLSSGIAQQGHTSVDPASPRVFATAPPESPPIDDGDARKPARVPWLRYGDRPARVAPPRRERTPLAPNPNPQTPTFPPSYEPLLTEEELRALMSDDIVATAGDEPATRWSDDDDPIRGAP